MLETYLNNYASILITISIACIVAFVMVLLPALAAKIRPYKDKNGPYECGFEPFSSSHESKFNVKFYIVAALFIIFDLEIAFMVPWALTLRNLSLFGFFSMISFIMMIFIGLLYEFSKGALDT